LLAAVGWMEGEEGSSALVGKLVVLQSNGEWLLASNDEELSFVCFGKTFPSDLRYLHEKALL